MPLMKDWVEIAVDEELLVPVVRELLGMALDANHVEVVHGPRGRLILADSRLADAWYQRRVNAAQKMLAESNVEDSNIAESSKLVAQSNNIAKPTKMVRPSASLKGEER